MTRPVDCDIDIDLADRNQLLDKIIHIPAIRVEKEQIKKHNSGIYLQNIPFNPVTGYATIDYKVAQNRGYFKFDLLNVSLYQQIKDENHLLKLMNTEPEWELLQEPEFVDLLFHVSGHSKILQTMKPQNIEQLAAVLAMIRPAKRYLIGKDWDIIFKEVWVNPNNGEYYYKQTHSIAYAHAVVIHMNLLTENIIDNL